MAARAIWKGVIRFGEVRLPVKLYSAIADRSVHFRLLHDQDLQPIRQRMINPLTGRSVEYREARRGYEFEKGTFVVLDKEELEVAEAEGSRDIQITRFVPAEVINHQWYERPYYLGPDGDEDLYFALAEALETEGREGVARWVMRKREYLGALRVEKGYLMLIALRHAEQLIPASEIPPPSGAAPTDRELAMAGQLVSALQGKFKPDEYHDDYRDRVMQLIEAKRRGETVQVEEELPEPTDGELLGALQASLGAVKKPR